MSLLHLREPVLFVALSVAFSACSDSSGSLSRTSLPLSPTSSRAPGTVVSSGPLSFARCLQGDGGAECFAGAAMSTLDVSGSAAVAPGPPVNFVASSSGSTVFLSWTAPASGDPATSYIIEAGSASGLSNLVTFNTNNTLTSFSASGIGPGTYFVRIRAINAFGTSAPSNEATLVVGGGGGCAGPPTALRAVSQSAGSISFAWGPPTTGTPTSYNIQAGSSPGLSNLANFNTGNTALSFSAGGIPAGSYYVRVHSLSSCGLSAPSNEILVFVVGFTGDVQVSVSWDAPSDVDLHVVEPSGEEIFYGHTVSASGGQLDVDSNPACLIDGRQIENIRWNTAAPSGTYTVRVDYFESCNVTRTNYLVTVKNGGSTTTFTGFFTGPGDLGGQGSGVFITSFNHADQRTIEPLRFLAPQLFVPSAEKLRWVRGRP